MVLSWRNITLSNRCFLNTHMQYFAMCIRVNTRYLQQRCCFDKRHDYRKDSAIRWLDYKTGVLFGLSFGDFCKDSFIRRVKFFAIFAGCLADHELSPKSTLHEILIIKETQYARETCLFFLCPRSLLAFFVTWRKVFSRWCHFCCLHEGRQIKVHAKFSLPDSETTKIIESVTNNWHLNENLVISILCK